MASVCSPTMSISQNTLMGTARTACTELRQVNFEAQFIWESMAASKLTGLSVPCCCMHPQDKMHVQGMYDASVPPLRPLDTVYTTPLGADTFASHISTQCAFLQGHFVVHLHCTRCAMLPLELFVTKCSKGQLLFAGLLMRRRLYR